MSDQIEDTVPRDMTILLIDDVPSARKVLHRMLNHLGFNNLHEGDGISDAMEYLAAKEIHLVISDVHLKDGLGMEILVKWKETPNFKEIPFIFITSDMEKETFKKAVELGAHSYLLKPFTQANLMSKIQEAVGSVK